MNSLHVRFNAHIVSLNPTWPSQSVGDKGKTVTLTGDSVLAGDSLTLCGTFTKKDSGLKANQWSWDYNGAPVGNMNEDLASSSFSTLFTQPNGGNVRDYIYKRIITRPNGLLVGMPTDTPNVGWIRYKTADRKYFPHTDSSRCFDFIVNGEGNRHDFVGELKNPHVKKHNNHLLGEVHALKLAVIANDSAVTEPDTPATRLGDLIYNDPGNLSDPNNGKTIRQILHLIDSALTYCDHFVAADYFPLDSLVSKINKAFDGPYVAVSFSPFKLAGTNPLPPFLHPNPSAIPVTIGTPHYSIIDEVPAQFAIYQNYPNPFNPTTTISFSLPEASVVTLTIYNVLGQEVVRVLDREQMDEGDQVVDFDATHLTSGVYFYRITAQSMEGNDVHQAVKRMLLLK
ncbi:MAG: T9SS type A sorting domain-containing protein [Ignavibacteriae bacterium]|nr:T9SS type A sorting domain-containing protein [Ignavibacteriota bacterium]